MNTPAAAVVQKIYLLPRPPGLPLPSSSPTTLFASFLPEVEKGGRGGGSHLHQAKLCWAALSVEKTWGFDSSHSMVINYFSTVVGPALLSSAAAAAAAVEVEVLRGGWRQHMISAALITGLTGKRPRQQQGNTSQSHPSVAPEGPAALARYMAFVYSLSCVIEKVQLSQSVCVMFPLNPVWVLAHPGRFLRPGRSFDLFFNHCSRLDGNYRLWSSIIISQGDEGHCSSRV